MDWSEMASITLEEMGQPVSFFRNGGFIESTSGIYRTKQESQRSRSKRLRVIDCDTVTVPFSSLIQVGDEVHVNGVKQKVAGEPVKDGTGGMIVMLSPLGSSEVDSDRFDR